MAEVFEGADADDSIDGALKFLPAGQPDLVVARTAGGVQQGIVTYANWFLLRVRPMTFTS